MMRSVLPKPSAKELWLMTGVPDVGAMEGKLAEIDLDDLGTEDLQGLVEVEPEV